LSQNDAVDTTMKIIWSQDAWDDYLVWQKMDKKVLKRINLLIKDVMRNKNDGIGKPEPLKHDWSGYWSRRINQEHRLVCRVSADEVLIAQCRYHY